MGSILRRREIPSPQAPKHVKEMLTTAQTQTHLKVLIVVFKVIVIVRHISPRRSRNFEPRLRQQVDATWEVQTENQAYINQEERLLAIFVFENLPLENGSEARYQSTRWKATPNSIRSHALRSDTLNVMMSMQFSGVL